MNALDENICFLSVLKFSDFFGTVYWNKNDCSDQTLKEKSYYYNYNSTSKKFKSF